MIKKKLLTALCFGLICTVVGVLGYNADRRLVIETANYQASQKLDKPVIVIDAGHGGADGGCVSVNGKLEKDINLNILLSLRDMLNVLGYDARCTRETDRSIHDNGVEGLRNQKESDMKNRLSLINRFDNAIAVSIHQNKFTDEQYSGAQMFYCPKVTGSEQLASIMQKQFVSKLQPDNTREIKQVTDELYLLNNAKCPAVMIECGFLSNKEEADKLESPDYQHKVAFTIFSGISEYRATNISI
ncbi:MAG: N-acetylmuramoyl-L-alanine amidase [Ruminococcus sp.]|nr:N-acetylmuramoyl-L-alanine amidase [Ruminococcus sp.]